MFQFASSLGIATGSNASLCLSYPPEGSDNPCGETLDDYFVGPFRWCPRPSGQLTVLVEKGNSIYTEFPPFRGAAVIKTNAGANTGFLQSWHYWCSTSDACLPKVREALTFRPAIREHARQFLTHHTSDGEIAIGVHVRRTDHVVGNYVCADSHTNNIPGSAYYKAAMDLMRARFNLSKVRFIVVSDDSEWCHTQPHFSDSDVSIVPDSLHHPPALDVAILSSCKHVIIGQGTFSWWAGWLSRGHVVYHGIALGEVEARKRLDNFPPQWIPLTTP